jgi:hypothetical protein
MPARRLSMRKIREVLRLKFGLGLKDREIARSCSIPHSSVANYVFRAKQAGLNTWPLVPDLEDEALETLLFRVLSAGLHDLTHQNLLPSAFALNRARRTDGSQPGSRFSR